MESEHVGENIRREGLYGIVQLTRCGVEVTACSSNLVLDVGNLRLQLQEVLICLQVGIGLYRYLQSCQCTRQRILSLDLVVDGGSVHGSGTSLGDTLQQLFLVLGITLYGGHQLRNQVVALLQLDIDVSEGILTIVTQFHEVVVDADARNHDDCNNY